MDYRHYLEFLKMEELKYTIGDYAWNRYYLFGHARTVANMAVHSQDKNPMKYSIGLFTQKLAYQYAPGIKLRWDTLIYNVQYYGCQPLRIVIARLKKDISQLEKVNTQ